MIKSLIINVESHEVLSQLCNSRILFIL